MLLTRSVEEILRHVMSNVQATFHDSRKRYAMKNRCLSFKMCRFPCAPVFFCVEEEMKCYTYDVSCGAYFFLSFVISSNCISFRVVSLLRSSSGSVGFRFVSCRRVAFRFLSCRRFVRPLVQLRFVSFRVDASWRKRKKQTKKNNKQTPTPISLWLAL